MTEAFPDLAQRCDAPAVPHAAPPLTRDAVLDAERAVHGYELQDRSRDGAAVRAALRERDADGAARRSLLFVSAGSALLDALLQDATIDASRLVLQVPSVPEHDGRVIAALLPRLQDAAQRGFALAFNANALRKPYAEWLALGSYLKFDARSADDALLATASRHLREHHPHVRMIACRVADQERFEHLRELGVPLFQGDWFARPAARPGGRLQPAQSVVIQLVNLLRADAEVEAIEEVLKRDPSLSFDLLRILNSAGMGLAVEVTSLRHAVMILGQQRLFRWATVLMTRARAAGTAPAVASAALVRGRLMELLARELMLQPQDCDNAFVAGVFSLMDVLLDVPLAQALQSIALPPPVADAVLHGQGLLAPFLALTQACEGEDAAAFGRAADALHLSSHQVNWAHLQALAWAEELAAGW